MSDEKEIRIDFLDDEIQPRSEKDIEIDELAANVRKKSREIANGAKDLSDYVKAFYLDYMYGSYDGLSWMFDQSAEGVSFEELVNDVEQGDRKKEVEKKTTAIEEMKKVLDSAPEKEGFVKVTIKKKRRGDDVLGLRVLAEFPSGVSVPHTGFDDNAAKYNEGKQIVYYEPNAACFENAFSDANTISLENSGNEYKVYYLPIMDTDEAQKNIRPGLDGIAEYVLGKDEEGNKIKQSMESFMWVALVHRGYKEDLHFRVSDFWKRNTEDNILKQKENTIVTEEVVEQQLTSLVPVFLILRDQLQTGHGALGKIDQSINEEGDPNEILASEVFKRYRQSLIDGKETEIRKFFFGNEEEYKAVVEALNDPLKLRILLGYYNIDDQANWRRASDAICNRQLHKNDGFPVTETIRQVLSAVNKF